MRYPTLALILCAAVHYASAAPTPHDEIQPDLNHNQIRQAEKQTLQEDNQVEQQSISMSSEELLQQPEILTDAMDTALARQNIDNIRFLLPLYRRMTGHDETMASYASAILSRADGKYKAAEHDLRNILANHPDYSPVRLQLALTLSQDGKMRDAAKELQEVRKTPDLPEPTLQYLNEFDKFLKKDKSWNFDGNISYVRDNNIARTPRERVYGGFEFEAPRTANGIAYDVSAQKNTPLNGHWVWKNNLSAGGKFYWDAHDYDDLTARAETGAGWRNHAQEISLSPFYERRWYGTEPYSNTSGGILRYSRVLSPKWQIFGAWQSGYRKHKERKFLNGANHIASISALYYRRGGEYFVFGVGKGYNSARDRSDAYKYENLRAGWTKAWGKSGKLVTSLNTTVQYRRYQAEDIFNIKRNDRETYVHLSAGHKKLSWKGFTPRLNWGWTHVHSNHFYYRQNQHRLFIDISKQF